jgi:hypothetical protein
VNEAATNTSRTPDAGVRATAPNGFGQDRPHFRLQRLNTLDVIRDQRVVRVRVELDTSVGVVVDPVVHYARPSGGADVDAVVVIRPLQPSKVVDALALDHRVLRQGRRAAEDEADALVPVRYFVGQELGVVALDGRARQGVSLCVLGPLEPSSLICGRSRSSCRRVLRDVS